MVPFDAAITCAFDIDHVVFRQLAYAGCGVAIAIASNDNTIFMRIPKVRP